MNEDMLVGVIIVLFVCLIPFTVQWIDGLSDDVSYCMHCGNMTHTVGGKCGKCGRGK